MCRGSPALLLRKCKRLQIARRQKELAWKAVARPHLPMALLAQRHRDWGCLLVLQLQTYLWGGSVQVASSSPALKMRTSADSSQPERASLESCCSASSAHGTARTEAQKLGLLACLATSNFKLTFRASLQVASINPALKMRTSADSSQPEVASLESCCSASSAHGPARTEAQRLGLLAYVANLKLQT